MSKYERIEREVLLLSFRKMSTKEVLSIFPEKQYLITRLEEIETKLLAKAVELHFTLREVWPMTYKDKFKLIKNVILLAEEYIDIDCGTWDSIMLACEELKIEDPDTMEECYMVSGTLSILP